MATEVQRLTGRAMAPYHVPHTDVDGPQGFRRNARHYDAASVPRPPGELQGYGRLNRSLHPCLLTARHRVHQHTALAPRCYSRSIVVSMTGSVNARTRIVSGWSGGDRGWSTAGCHHPGHCRSAALWAYARARLECIDDRRQCHYTQSTEDTSGGAAQAHSCVRECGGGGVHPLFPEWKERCT